MPAPRRTPDTQEDDPVGLDCCQNNRNRADDEEESDRSPWSGQGEKDELVAIKLSDIRRTVQCPICLGIIRKTRTVMECLHRFCRECIDKSMRLGNNECPACRTHCASRRSLRDDPKYDTFIAILYPDIDKYEEEELAFQDDEKARNKQIQDAIAQTLRRQQEALSKKRTAKATAAVFVRRSQGNSRNAHPRRRRNSLISADLLQDSDDNEDGNGNEEGKDSSSDERTETKQKRGKRWVGERVSQSSAAAGGDENDPESNKEFMGASPVLVGSSDRLSWGKGGIRSRGNGKNSRNSRISKLVDHLRNSEKNEDEIQLDIHLTLVSLDKQSIPSLEKQYLCCRPTLSVRHLSQFVASLTAVEANEVEICLVKELPPNFSFLKSAVEVTFETSMIEPGTDKLQVLGEQDTLAELTVQNLFQGPLILGYRRKLESKECFS